jgi:hypothetical protein
MRNVQGLLRALPVLLSVVALAAGGVNVQILEQQISVCAQTETWITQNSYSNFPGRFGVVALPWLALAVAHYLCRRKESAVVDIWSVLTVALAAFTTYLNLHPAAPFASQQLCDGIWFREYNDAADLVQVFLVLPYAALSVVVVFVSFLIRKILGRWSA